MLLTLSILEHKFERLSNNFTWNDPLSTTYYLSTGTKNYVHAFQAGDKWMWRQFFWTVSWPLPHRRRFCNSARMRSRHCIVRLHCALRQKWSLPSSLTFRSPCGIARMWALHRCGGDLERNSGEIVTAGTGLLREQSEQKDLWYFNCRKKRNIIVVWAGPIRSQ